MLELGSIRMQDVPSLGLTNISAVEIFFPTHMFVLWKTEHDASFSSSEENRQSGFHRKYQHPQLRRHHPLQFHHQNQCDPSLDLNKHQEEPADPEDDDDDVHEALGEKITDFLSLHQFLV